MTRLTVFARLAVACLILLCTAHARAAMDFAWEFDAWNSDNQGNGGCVAACANGRSSSEFRGYSATSEPAPRVTLNAWADTHDRFGDDALEHAELHRYGGGYGVYNKDSSQNVHRSPWHAVNGGGDYDDGQYRFEDMEAIEFVFGAAIALQEVVLGWKTHGLDSADFSVLAYVGNDGADNDADLNGQTYQGLTDSGWQFIGHYTDNRTGSRQGGRIQTGSGTAINTGNIAANRWIVTVLNPDVDPSCDGGIDCAARHYSAGNDYFKILALAGNAAVTIARSSDNGIPGPATWALVVLGLGLLRRRRTRPAALHR